MADTAKKTAAKKTAAKKTAKKAAPKAPEVPTVVIGGKKFTVDPERGRRLVK